MKKIPIKKLTTLEFKKIKRETIIFTKDTHKWCQRPYRDKKRCPNYNKNPLCPSDGNKNNIPFFNDVVLNYSFFYLVYADFDFYKYIQNRSALSPDRTKNQIKCVLYWQNSVKALLKKRIEKIYRSNRNSFYVIGCGSGFNLSFQKKVYSMEAVGINVFSTMKLNGVALEINPIHSIRLICLLCSKKELTPIIQTQLTSFR